MYQLLPWCKRGLKIILRNYESHCEFRFQTCFSIRERQVDFFSKGGKINEGKSFKTIGNAWSVHLARLHCREYDADIRNMVLDGKNSKEIYEAISQSDVQGAAHEFRMVYKETDGKDGYVSLEVNPHLAHDTEGTIIEARRLWMALKSSNVLIKVPATLEGLKAIQQLTSEGINVNATLLFGVERYRMIADAYIAGLKERVTQGKPIHNMASVASFFVSRIDVLVDPMLEKIINHGSDKLQYAKQVHGQVAVSCAKAAYQIYKEIFSSDRFKRLADHGARTQRLLWASTGTKNKDYSDVKYVEALLGRIR